MIQLCAIRCGYKFPNSSKEVNVVLCVNSEGVTAFNLNTKGCSPIICKYTFHQILSWTVSPKQCVRNCWQLLAQGKGLIPIAARFLFHVMKRQGGQNVKTPFGFSTPDAREVSLRLKSHVVMLFVSCTSTVASAGLITPCHCVLCRTCCSVREIKSKEIIAGLAPNSAAVLEQFCMSSSSIRFF